MSTEINNKSENIKTGTKSALPGAGIVGGMAVAGGLAGAAVSGAFDSDADAEIASAEIEEVESPEVDSSFQEPAPHKVQDVKPHRNEPEPDKIDEEPEEVKPEKTDPEDLSYRLDMAEWERDLPELMPDVVTDGVLDPEKMIVELNDDGSVASMTSIETGTIYEVSYSDGQAYISTPQGEMITALPGEAFAQVAPNMPAIESVSPENVSPAEIASVETVEVPQGITEDQMDFPEPAVDIASLPSPENQPAVIDDNEAIVIDTNMPDSADMNGMDIVD